MKLMHLSDLHIGKRLNETSFADDQKYILSEILRIAKEEKADAVMIAGDVYDVKVPSAEAIKMTGDFMADLASLNVPVFIISGNHDSQERIAYLAPLLKANKVYVSEVYDGTIERVDLSDEYGRVSVYMMPFLKPSFVRNAYPDEDIQTYDDAVRIALEKTEVDETVRNVIISHQFVAGDTDVERSESEEAVVGGLDRISINNFERFDYTALGHIHKGQNVTADGRIRYCGTPLKYSFSEAEHNKSVTMVELKEKGDITVTLHPLKPMRDLKNIRGTIDEILHKNLGAAADDYVRVILTDEEMVVNARDKVRSRYPNLLSLEFDNTSTRHNATLEAVEAVGDDFGGMFADFYKQINGRELTGEAKEYIYEIADSLKD